MSDEEWDVEEWRTIVERQEESDTFWVCFEDCMEMLRAYDASQAEVKRQNNGRLIALQAMHNADDREVKLRAEVKEWRDRYKEMKELNEENNSDNAKELSALKQENISRLADAHQYSKERDKAIEAFEELKQENERLLVANKKISALEYEGSMIIGDLKQRAEKLVEALEKIKCCKRHRLEGCSNEKTARTALRAFNQPSEKEK